MSQEHADRNLLFGILALQMNFITREQLVAAMQAWVLDKTQALGQILVKHKVLDSDTNTMLEALLIKHLAQHGGNVEKSLAALSSAVQIREDLSRVTDPDLQASLGHIGASMQLPADPFATRDSAVGAPSGSTLHGARGHTGGTASATGLRFRILRPHARGGLGEVLVARDSELNREVALKQIQTRHAHNDESQARFVLEAEITGGLEHPGIVPVYGLGHYSDGRPFYAMRFIRGDSLKEALERFHATDKPDRDPGERARELRDLLRRFVDVCNAIGYAHSRGVLHRDLKPGNIMLGKYGETLVVDWGLAKPLAAPASAALAGPGEGSLMPSSASLGSHTLMGSAMGTPQYMSPEQAAGRLDILGPASDVYSLGATLYSILTGAPPIQDTGADMVIKKVQLGLIPLPSTVKANVPKPLEAVCMKAMALQPEHRYLTAQALADDIELWLADEPVSAWPEPWTVKARRWIGKHRTSVTTVAAAVLVATVSLAVATIFLDVAWRAESAARAEAAHNYDIARKAVDRYSETVTEEEVLHGPGMEPLRKRLLESATAFYEQFVRENDQKPGVKAGLGKALYQLAQITGDIDSKDDAIKMLERARGIFVSLTEDESHNPALESDLASCWHHLGRLHRLTYKLDRSEVAYNEALKIWQPLVDKHPRKDFYRAELARSQLGLGNAYQVNRLNKEAAAIYKEAKDTLQKLADDNPKDLAYKRDLALSYSNLATVLISLGKTDDAKAAFVTAIDKQQQLVEADRRISEYQADLARSHNSLGSLDLDVARTSDGLGEQLSADTRAEAEEHFTTAESIWTDLKKTHPRVLDFQSKLADTLTLQASAKLFGTSPDATVAAVKLCKQAIAIQQKLVDDYQDIAGFQGDLARGYSRLGEAYQSAGEWRLAEGVHLKAVHILDKVTKGPTVTSFQFEGELAQNWNELGFVYGNLIDEDKKAEEAYRKALTLWKKLVAARPEDLNYSVKLSVTQYDLGNLLWKNGKPDDALQWYTRAVEAVEGVALPKRKATDIQVALRNAYWGRAETLNKLGQHKEALPDWNKTLELAGEQAPRIRLQRAVALARAGEHAEATAEAESLKRDALKKRSGLAFFELGRVYAICSGEAAKDFGLPANQRQPTAEKYADRAVVLLGMARSKDSSRTPVNLERLRTDNDFDPIRQQAEFSRLLD